MLWIEFCFVPKNCCFEPFFVPLLTGDDWPTIDEHVIREGDDTDEEDEEWDVWDRDEGADSTEQSINNQINKILNELAMCFMR